MDLLEHYELLPVEVQDILNRYSEADNTYINCAELEHELNNVGYSIDYGLDAIPFDLIKIEFSEEMEVWIADNVIKEGENCFREQTTQYAQIFTKIELIRFFNEEFGIDEY